MTVTRTIEQYVTSGDLIEELADRTPAEGTNDGLWPGLTFYRFTEPSEPRWERIRALSIGIVAQGSKAVWSDGVRHVYDQFNYLVIRSGLHFECQIVEASAEKPCLCLVLEIEPALVRQVSVEMPRRRNSVRSGGVDRCEVSALDEELMGSVLRFLKSLTAEADRRILAPMYLREIVYRVLQREQYTTMMHIAREQDGTNPLAPALRYIDAHLDEPLTVATLADQVSLSASAFSRLFREVTGTSPYQYVKEVRMARARELIVGGRLGVAEVAHTVGYASVSHFIKEFRNRYRATPRDYAERRVDEA